MSSSSSALPSQHQLTDILKIPLQEDHCCLGTSNSFNRRCHNLVHRRHRREARQLLAQGSLRLQQGNPASSLDPLLTELAPLLLCTGAHQHQAPTLVAQWKEKLLAHHSNMNRPVVQAGTAVALAPAPRPDVLDPRSSGETAGVTVNAAAALVSPSPMLQNNHHQQQQVMIRQTLRFARDHQQPVFLPQSQLVREEWCNNLTRPRPVKGECGICLLPYADDPAGYDDVEDGDDYDYGSSYYSLAPPDYDHENLTWCRAFCGTNYHRKCMDQWIETFDVMEPTCPTCRKFWVDD
ncbi:hypothetical protein BO70DRAFT_413949 [Aspergillus heteromorphus CBS 117.55]|uniref:Anaphase-promoting complex subunit 11 RING-H2 finger domain-containing protein n=1 Tax=Aspergillus heteromorphus CBS 117.55 TaxID=1448321 RepID=A0A317VFS0_9EURO|nr:uncharacterized protein BO70DRAFT_413949 [Aspergillus heteromorphus CBS 117.55]PWY72289.1 hypothetical protein BO70DRAFT_413949 [Aspergillus heteromorphus CBS 117.55]